MLLIAYIPSLICWLAQTEYQDYNNIHNLTVAYVFLPTSGENLNLNLKQNRNTN